MIINKIFIVVLITTTFNTSVFAKRAAIVIDYDTNEVLFEVNADTLNFKPYFKKSLVLICDDNKDGTMGLIINKPIDDNLMTKMLLDLDIENTRLSNAKIYFGGPVNLDTGFFLHGSNYHTDKTLNISNNQISDLPDAICSLDVIDGTNFLFNDNILCDASTLPPCIIELIDFTEAYNMPVKWRKWWLNKVSEINEEENQKRMQPASAAVQPQARSLRARDVGR